MHVVCGLDVIGKRKTLDPGVFFQTVSGLSAAFHVYRIGCAIGTRAYVPKLKRNFYIGTFIHIEFIKNL